MTSSARRGAISLNPPAPVVLLAVVIAAASLIAAVWTARSARAFDESARRQRLQLRFELAALTRHGDAARLGATDSAARLERIEAMLDEALRWSQDATDTDRARARQIAEEAESARGRIETVLRTASAAHASERLSASDMQHLLARASAARGLADADLPRVFDARIDATLGELLDAHGMRRAALRHLRWAIRPGADPLDAHAHAAVRIAIADVLLWLGRDAEALAAAVAAHDLLPLDATPAQRIAILAVLAESLRHSGEIERATELLRERLEVASDDASFETESRRAVLLDSVLDLARNLVARGELDDAERLVRQQRDRAVSAEDGDGEFLLTVQLVDVIDARAPTAESDALHEWVCDRLRSREASRAVARRELTHDHLLRRNAFAIAEPLLEEAAMASSDGSTSPALARRNAGRMVRLYEGTDRPELADVWRLGVAEPNPMDATGERP